MAWLTVAILSTAAAGEPYPLRWVYAQVNLADPVSVTATLQLISRARDAGLNGIVLSDAKFMTLEKYGHDRPSSPYYRHVQQVLRAARLQGIEIIPHVGVVSRAEGLFAYDPNLAEGFEVRDAVFEVRGGVAQLVPDPTAFLRDGGFERAEENRFVEWSSQDGPGKVTIPDSSVARSGRQSIRLEPSASTRPPGLARINQRVKVTPRRCYRVSVWVQTQGLEPANSFNISVSGLSPGTNRPLAYNSFAVAASQGWKQVHAVFNSLDYTEIIVHLGVWHGRRGRVWLDDAELVEIGLVNVLRRQGCPLTVRSIDGRITYREERDYARVEDRRLGRARAWLGVFDRYHEPPSIRMLNGLADGTRLKVSFYHPLVVHGGQVDACMTEPAADAVFERQIRSLHRTLGSPKRWFLGYNEIRAGGSCAACKGTGQTPGEILANHVRRTVATVRRVVPGAELVTWHDMFSPAGNARDHYYLVEGTMAGSWEGLPGDMLICNWTGKDLEKSLKFFAERGHGQVASINFDDVTDVTAATRKALEILDRTPHAMGLLFTTWKKRYEGLEEFGRLLGAHSPGAPGER
ncbi:MAG TPA: hypothetical protein PK579_11085 [Phycisphaerae bacterium]|nr:hypothetical protein [Phycisphaerae bacterium]